MEASSNNILSGGVDALLEIKKDLTRLNQEKEQNDTLLLEQKNLERSIQNLEKVIADEIQTTIKMRRKEIEDTFDEQADKVRTKMKKTKEKREKWKDSKVSERINVETAPLREENNSFNKEAKAVLRQKRMPFFCNTKLYFALYSPSSFSDFLIILSALIIVLLLIPFSIYFFVLPQEKTGYLFIIYFVTVVIFGGIYAFIYNRTKEKYPEEIKQVRGIRNSIRMNNKKMNVMKKRIKKDRDESGYGLENFDQELAKYSQEEADIENQKKEALDVFDHTTSKVITEEIKGQQEEKLSKLRMEYDRAIDKLKDTDEKIKALTIKIASEYEPYLGKELVSLESLEELIHILQAGSAETVSEAISFYKKRLSENL